MCIIAHMPVKATRIGEEVIRHCWTSNPDGAGLMYPDAARKILVIDKGHMTVDALIEAFTKVPEGVPVCMHFRIKTHGPRDPANTHPHVVLPDETAICHNGVLPIGAPADSPESDTARFARLVLANFPKRWFKNAAMVHLVEEYMGKGNKIVAMDATGAYAILNESAGTWEQGVWFSNQTFRSYRYAASSYVHGGSSHGYDQDYYGGWGATDQTRAENRKALAGPGSTHGDFGNRVQPAVSADASGAGSDAEETQLLDPITALDATDPLVVAIHEGKLTQEDQSLFYKDIGSMSDAEFARYEEIMGMAYGVAP